ncbi:hypothetical protein D3C87_377220 [compost metagenome]
MCNDSNNGKPLSRRNFLGGALTVGAGSFLFDPVRAVTEGIADSFITKAHAEATGTVAGRNYVNIQMAGAPIRYQFDQWLRISNGDPALQVVNATKVLNAMTCNSFNVAADGKVTPAMRYITYNNVLVPHLFGQKVFNSKGEQRPLTDLLKNMLVVRGFGSGLDGHEFNMRLQVTPIGGVSTISGVVAENSATTFDSIQWPDRGSRGVYASSGGKPQSKLAGTTPLNTLMEGFGNPKNVASRNLKSKYQEAMELAQNRLKAYARSENAGAKLLSQNLTNASEMMKKGVSDLNSYWTAAVARYKAAIESSMRQTNIVGVSDKPLTSDESVSWNFGTGDIIPFSKERDVRDAIINVSIKNYAESLALAEYALKEKLASSIDVRADELMNVAIQAAKTTSTVAKPLGLDMHNTGSNAVILLMNSYYRGIAAGILELKDQLGAEIWENTVVQLQGDFGRTARSAGSGSDHGYNQMVTSAFTGAFTNGPVVVGNIKLAGHSAAYDGTQGIAAPIEGYNQKGMPSAVMAASTVTALLNVKHNPYANSAAPLVSLGNGVLKALATAKIVA